MSKTIKMIVRVEADNLVEKLLTSTEEESDESPLEFLDQRMDSPNYNVQQSFEIEAEVDEKHFEKSKNKDIIKDSVKEKGVNENAKSNTEELERN